MVGTQLMEFQKATATSLIAVLRIATLNAKSIQQIATSAKKLKNSSKNEGM